MLVHHYHKKLHISPTCPSVEVGRTGIVITHVCGLCVCLCPQDSWRTRWKMSIIVTV